MFFRRSKKNLQTELLSQAKTASIRTKFSFYTVISTWFYIGKCPIAPGTVASLSTYPIFQFILERSFSYIDLKETFLILTIILLLLGWWCIHKFQVQTKTSDHRMIVIDEVIGQLLTFYLSYEMLHKIAIPYANILGMTSQNLSFLLGVLVFRYFDISKPFIIKYIDRWMKGASGVILDDVVASLFSAGTIYIIYTLYEKLALYI